MSLSVNIQNLATRTGSEFKRLRSEVAEAAQNGGAAIDDTAASTSSVYSSARTEDRITASAAATRQAILGGAGPAFDTLAELKELIDLAEESDQIAALTTLIGTKVSFTENQTLTAEQQRRALTNIAAAAAADVGDPDVDLVGVFERALV